jgi:hypothetical protein
MNTNEAQAALIALSYADETHPDMTGSKSNPPRYLSDVQSARVQLRTLGKPWAHRPNVTLIAPPSSYGSEAGRQTQRKPRWLVEVSTGSA